MGNAHRLIRITDGKGRLVAPDEATEPEVDSIVLVRGPHGTCLQRHATDGLWYPAGRGRTPRTWQQILTDRDVLVVYNADPRPALERVTIPVQTWATGQGN